jgi:FlaA1/EpsC-like NDP-sugar epimerase
VLTGFGLAYWKSQSAGLRPGEKLYEELLTDPEKAEGTAHPRIFRSYEPLPETTIIQAEVGVLKKAITENDLEAALSVMCRLVSEYGPLEQSQLLENHSIVDNSSISGLVN